MIEQLEILRRIAERGKKFAEAEPAYRDVDIWVHMLDEIARLRSDSLYEHMSRNA